MNSVDVNIVDFIDKLIEKRDFPDFTPEVRAELRKMALSRFYNFILNRTIDKLPDEDLETFSKMVDEKKSAEEFEAFVKEHIPDYEKFMTGVLREFEKMYLEG